MIVYKGITQTLPKLLNLEYTYILYICNLNLAVMLNMQPVVYLRFRVKYFSYFLICGDHSVRLGHEAACMKNSSNMFELKAAS